MKMRKQIITFVRKNVLILIVFPIITLLCVSGLVYITQEKPESNYEVIAEVSTQNAYLYDKTIPYLVIDTTVMDNIKSEGAKSVGSNSKEFKVRFNLSKANSFIIECRGANKTNTLNYTNQMVKLYKKVLIEKYYSDPQIFVEKLKSNMKSFEDQSGKKINFDSLLKMSLNDANLVTFLTTSENTVSKVINELNNIKSDITNNNNNLNNLNKQLNNYSAEIGKLNHNITNSNKIIESLEALYKNSSEEEKFFLLGQISNQKQIKILDESILKTNNELINDIKKQIANINLLINQKKSKMAGTEKILLEENIKFDLFKCLYNNSTLNEKISGSVQEIIEKPGFDTRPRIIIVVFVISLILSIYVAFLKQYFVTSNKKTGTNTNVLNMEG